MIGPKQMAASNFTRLRITLWERPKLTNKQIKNQQILDGNFMLRESTEQSEYYRKPMANCFIFFCRFLHNLKSPIEIISRITRTHTYTHTPTHILIHLDLLCSGYVCKWFGVRWCMIWLFCWSDWLLSLPFRNFSHQIDQFKTALFFLTHNLNNPN